MSDQVHSSRGSSSTPAAPPTLRREEADGQQCSFHIPIAKHRWETPVRGKWSSGASRARGSSMKDGEAPRWTDETWETNATREKSQATGPGPACALKGQASFIGLLTESNGSAWGPGAGASVACMGGWDGARGRGSGGVAIEVDMIWAASPGADSLHYKGLSRPAVTGQPRAQPRPCDFCDASRSHAWLAWLDWGWDFRCSTKCSTGPPRAGATRGPSPSFLESTLQQRRPPAPCLLPAKRRDQGPTPVIKLLS